MLKFIETRPKIYFICMKSINNNENRLYNEYFSKCKLTNCFKGTQHFILPQLEP